MREPWDLTRDFVQMMANSASQDNLAGDNALMNIFKTATNRGDMGTQQGYNLQTLAKRNDYATQADTTAFDRQVQRDQSAFQHQDATRAQDRGWATSDDERDFKQSKELAQFQQQMLAEREGFARGGVSRRYGDPSGGGGGGNDAASVLRKFEGFRDTPYWDVNHLRVGYGSDTWTDEQGHAHRVDANTRVDRAAAERDLSRRAQESAGVAARQVGPDKWSSLPPNVTAALTSVTYNYGSLPNKVVAAVQSGDPKQIAMAVASLGSDNEGVNAKRRQQEAAIIAGGGEGFIQDDGQNYASAGAGGDDYANTILTNPTPNSGGLSAEDVPPDTQQLVDASGKEVVGRKHYNQTQLDILAQQDPELFKNIMPDPLHPYDGKLPMYLITRNRPTPDASTTAAGDGTKAIQGPQVLLKTSPRGRYVDGQLQLEDIELPD